jgi:NADH-quinone oxidoreductase subunit E
VLSAELRQRAEEIVGRYPVARSALLPLLHLVQHADGYLSDDGVAECAELLDLTMAEVGAVATFYTMYKREPLGEHLVSVCTNFSCAVRGANEVYARLSETLGVGHNQTTADGAFTLEHAECLGNCEGAPVVSVDYLNYECLDADAAERLVGRVASGDAPAPTRGFVPPGVRAVQHRLAGLGPVPGSGGPGVASDQARAADGAVPVRDFGPGVEPVTVEPTFLPGHAAEREEAKAAVRDQGQDPDAVEEAAGPQAREFPTTDPDWEPSRGGSRDGSPHDHGDDDPRQEDQADDAGGEHGGSGRPPEPEEEV